MRDWFTAIEILPFAGEALPGSLAGLTEHAVRDGWRRDAKRSRVRFGQGGGYEYHVSLLPAEVRARLAAYDEAMPASVLETGAPAVLSPLWAAFEGLSNKSQVAARQRHAAVTAVSSYGDQISRQAAVALVATEFGVSRSSLWDWLALVAGVHRSDWLPVLAPRYAGGQQHAQIDARAWDFIVADYLRPSRPGFAGCYERLLRACIEQNWGAVPSAKTLKRRIEAEFPPAVRTLAREGREAAARMMPHQRRDRTVFAALEALNADGHKFDVFVKYPDGVIGRPMLLAFQDVRSGLVVGWRLDRSENKEVVRLAFGDVVMKYGIPEHVYFDNGRHFSSKWLTGRMPFRFRFKVRDEEPEGILTTMGVKVHFTTPYRGQSKPIERAFRDLAERIAKHPACDGAYTGNTPLAKPENYGSRALPIADFEGLVASEIRAHNQRQGRRGFGMGGRSFEEVFAQSMPELGLRRATAEQHRLFMLAAEGVTARKPNGLIEFMDNRFWAEELTSHIGAQLVVRFDPQNLHDGMAVYSLDNRFICKAERLDDIGFNSVDDAREQQLIIKRLARNRREMLELNRRLDANEVARLTPGIDAPEAPEPPQKVIRLVAGGRSRPAFDHSDFSAGLDRLTDETGGILPFNTPR